MIGRKDGPRRHQFQLEAAHDHQCRDGQGTGRVPRSVIPNLVLASGLDLAGAFGFPVHGPGHMCQLAMMKGTRIRVISFHL